MVFNLNKKGELSLKRNVVGHLKIVNNDMTKFMCKLKRRFSRVYMLWHT